MARRLIENGVSGLLLSNIGTLMHIGGRGKFHLMDLVLLMR